jgi:hypothetical protein
MKRITAALLALSAGLLAAGVAVFGTPAAATEPRPVPVCAVWEMRGATGAYPDVTFGGAPRGSYVRSRSAKLVKPAEGTAPGVEFATFALGYTAQEDVTVTVDFELGGSASFAAGAVRLFGYKATGADTLNDAPDFTAIASASEGALSFPLPEGSTLGTLGMVYDASNEAKGSVVFSDLRIGDRPVRFKPCPKPDGSASASASVSSSVSSSASASASSSASASASVSSSVSSSASPSRPVVVVPGGTGAGPSLPITGPSVPLLVGGGLLLAAAGLGLVFLVRRRKVRFSA